MSKFYEYLLNEKEKSEAYLIESENNRTGNKGKEDYVVNAEKGVIVAFRLNFEARSGVKLTKVISGKIIDNIQDKEQYVVETRNGLNYGVPYAAVVWVKTGDRWPKGVYEEMKLGSVAVDDSDLELSELETPAVLDDLDGLEESTEDIVEDHDEE